jgi:hypothetical protein
MRRVVCLRSDTPRAWIAKQSSLLSDKPEVILGELGSIPSEDRVILVVSARPQDLHIDGYTFDTGSRALAVSQVLGVSARPARRG